MAFNTQGGVTGGAFGAVIGGLAGFFTEHALSTRKTVKLEMSGKRQAEYTAGGAVIGAALGAFFGGTAAPTAAGGSTPSIPGGGTAPPAPGGGASGVTDTVDNGPGSYWASLSNAQQASYTNALYTWYAANNAAANAAVGGISVSSASDLYDSSQLMAITDAYQTVNGRSPQTGVIDAATYQAVTQ